MPHSQLDIFNLEIMKVQKWILLMLLVLVVVFLEDAEAGPKKNKKKKSGYYISGQVRRALEKVY